MPALLLLLVGLGLPLGAQAIPDRPLTRGSVAFDGHGTLGDFTGTTTSVRGMLVGAATLEGLRGWVAADVDSLTTGNGKRDSDMRKSLEAERHPMLRFELLAVGAGAAEGDSIPVTLRGRFTIHGVAREQAVTGWVWRTAEAVRFRGRTPMHLPDYRIGGLSKFLGLFKMYPDVVVRMDLTF